MSSGASVFYSDSSVAERPPPASAGGRQVVGSNPSPGTDASIVKWPHDGPNEPVEEGSNPSGRAKLYAVVSSSLSAGAKACQAAHALRAYADAYPDIERKWWTESNTLVLLETDAIVELEIKAHNRGVSCVRFVEPDWAPAGTLTALVLGPEGKKLVSSLKLAFR